LAAIGTFNDKSTQDLTIQAVWSAADGTGKATVSNALGSEGTVTGTAAGTATITATIPNTTPATATVTVTQ
jgi:predicted ATPase